jgi:hypothetical protein
VPVRGHGLFRCPRTATYRFVVISIRLAIVGRDGTGDFTLRIVEN